MSFLSRAALLKKGFKNVGENALISRRATFYNIESISIGNNVRIDDFCLISGGRRGHNLTIGNNVHIASHCGIWAASGVTIGDFAGISSGCKIYSESDDFSGEYLCGPYIPDEYRNVISGKIDIGEYVVIGAETIVVPGIIMGEGCAIGSNGFVNMNCDPWCIYVGTPIKYIKERNKNMLILSNKLTRETE